MHKAYTASAPESLSLHHEGRAAIISLTTPTNMQALMYLAAGIARFDYVRLETNTTLYVSVAEDTCEAPVDLMFLLDDSGSVESSRQGGMVGAFKSKVVGFVKALVPKFNFGPGDEHSRLGLVTFSDNVRTNMYMGQHQSQAQILAALDRVSYGRGGRTKTAAGLHAVLATLLKQGRGLRADAKAIPRVLIIITDGRSYPTTDAPTSQLMQKLRNLNVKVYALGVGLNVNRKELEIMASQPHTDHLHMLQSFHQLVRKWTVL